MLFLFCHGQFQVQYLQPDANFIWAVGSSVLANFFLLLTLEKFVRIKSQLRKFIFDSRKSHRTTLFFVRFLRGIRFHGGKMFRISCLAKQFVRMKKSRKNYRMRSQMLRKSHFICRANYWEFSTKKKLFKCIELSICMLFYFYSRYLGAIRFQTVPNCNKNGHGKVLCNFFHRTGELFFLSLSMSSAWAFHNVESIKKKENKMQSQNCERTQ